MSEPSWALPCTLEGEHCLLKPASICGSFPVSTRIPSQSWTRGALRSLVGGWQLHVKKDPVSILDKSGVVQSIFLEIIDHEVELYHT